MTITAVESTTLARIAYDELAHALYLEFRDRTIYCYREVPYSTYVELLRAQSKGAYFNRSIRGQFSHRRIPHSSDLRPYEMQSLS